jgi:2,6-dihydroxypseudooxynicotine hydrolase
VDWIEKRSDLDSKRMAIWGVSLGGYYAPRAAAYEKRFKACIALSGPFDWAQIWDGLPDLTRETFRLRSHSKNQEQAKQRAAALTLKDAAKNITCPLFIVAGRQDRLVPAAEAEQLARSVSGPVELLMVEDGGHNANNRPYRYRSRSADWLAERFGLPKL